MSDWQQGPGWWLASDGRWYPPESLPGGGIPPPPTNGSSLPAWLLPSHVSGWAVASGYLGLFSLILFGFPGPFAIWTGVRGLRQIKRQPGLNGSVRAWVGIVLGALGCIVLALVLLVAVAYIVDPES